MNKVCGDAYKAHYECLDNHNQQYKDCRPAERGLNACVFMRMVSPQVETYQGISESGAWTSGWEEGFVARCGSILWTERSSAGYPRPGNGEEIYRHEPREI